MTLIGPIPQELAESDPPGIRNDDGRSSTSPSRRFRWATLAILAVGITALLVGVRIGACFDPGGCMSEVNGGPLSWVAALAFSGLAIYAARRAVLG